VELASRGIAFEITGGFEEIAGEGLGKVVARKVKTEVTP
jgi:hypothetical protein